MNTGHTLFLPPEAGKALLILQNWLGSSLKAVYLHGSAVGQGLRKQSDVDLLAVIEGPLSLSVSASLASELQTVSGLYPVDPAGRRPLEVMIFQVADLEQPSYPARAEFVYGEWLREAFEGGHVPQPESSPEFTLMLAQARKEAVSLIGPNLADIVPDIASDAVRKAIGDLLPDLMSSVDGDERNVILTMARMWVTLATSQFVSKDAAAAWAGPRLSDEAERMLKRARDAYLGDIDDDLYLRKAEVLRTIREMADRILAIL